MKYFVYLIISTHKNKTTSYVGYTSNIANRIKLHNSSKGAKFTRGRYWKLIYKKGYATKAIAMRNEFILKKNYKERLKIKKNYLNNK